MTLNSKETPHTYHLTTASNATGESHVLYISCKSVTHTLSLLLIHNAYTSIPIHSYCTHRLWYTRLLYLYKRIYIRLGVIEEGGALWWGPRNKLCLQLSLSLCVYQYNHPFHYKHFLSTKLFHDSFVWCAQSTLYTTQSHLLWLYCHTFTLTNSSQLIFPARIHYTAMGLLVT